MRNFCVRVLLRVIGHYVNWPSLMIFILLLWYFVLIYYLCCLLSFQLLKVAFNNNNSSNTTKINYLNWCLLLLITFQPNESVHRDDCILIDVLSLFYLMVVCLISVTANIKPPLLEVMLFLYPCSVLEQLKFFVLTKLSCYIVIECLIVGWCSAFTTFFSLFSCYAHLTDLYYIEVA